MAQKGTRKDRLRKQKAVLHLVPETFTFFQIHFFFKPGKDTHNPSEVEQIFFPV